MKIKKKEKRKKDKNDLAVSNVDRMKNIFQESRHYTSAQSILESMKHTAKSIHFYTLNFIHYQIYQNLWEFLIKVAFVHCSESY